MKLDRVCAAVGVVALLSGSEAMAAQTYGYVVSSLSTATWNDYTTNCPKNLNGFRKDEQRRDLLAIGFTADEADKMLKSGGEEGVPRDVAERLLMRAVVNGKPASDVKLDFLIRGGWVSARQTTAGLTGSVQTFTDTVMSGTATYLGFTGIQQFAGLSVNAPSGRSARGCRSSRRSPSSPPFSRWRLSVDSWGPTCGPFPSGPRPR